MNSPPLDEVRSFSNHLHATGKHWQGVIFGWSAAYTPSSRRKPVESNMTLGLPLAEFWIGESGIWFFSQRWEPGKDKEPVEFLDDRGIVQ